MTQPLALYIHWPFCASKCPYCDFNSHVRSHIDETAWEKAYHQELLTWSARLPQQKITSIFFGGGTPSLMSGRLVASILETIHSLWSVSSSVEITLEANPNSVERQRFQSFRDAGIQRISLGIQSLRDRGLTFLGRTHTAADAKRALHTVQKIFPRYSFDLIYAYPNQTLESWTEELQEALEEARDHLSLYMLTLEKGTRFFDEHARGDWSMPSDDLSAQFYETTNAIMAHQGWYAYEISNYTRRHHGQMCEHNLAYWEGRDYVGIGPGAHGRWRQAKGQRCALKNFRAPETWLHHVKQHGHGLEDRQPLTPQQQAEEYLMMGLRLHKGIQRQHFTDTMGFDIFKTLDPSRWRILEDEGLVLTTPQTLRLTDPGRQKLHAVLAYALNAA